jgi:hypothetical protein
MKGKRRTWAIIGVIVSACGIIYFTTGLFVIQPIGALPEGRTFWYWRVGTNLPFLSSPDGILLKRVGHVSILGRGLALGTIAQLLRDRKIAALPYSDTLYLITTKGAKFQN